MEYDREKVDEMVLVLLALTMFPEGSVVRPGLVARAGLHLRPEE